MPRPAPRAPAPGRGLFPPLPDPCTARLAGQAMRLAHGEVEAVARWLVSLGGQLSTLADDEAVVVGPSGRTVGLRALDPVGAAILLGIALFEMAWPLVVPGLVTEVKRRWRAERRAAKESPDDPLV